MFETFLSFYFGIPAKYFFKEALLPQDFPDADSNGTQIFSGIQIMQQKKETLIEN